MKSLLALILLTGASAATASHPFVLHQRQIIAPRAPFVEVSAAAVDGDWLLIMEYNLDGVGALLYHFTSASGWRFDRVLDQAAAPGDAAQGVIAFENSIAAFKLGSQLRVYELGAAGWARSTLAADVRDPDGAYLAIDGQRILTGGFDCTRAAQILEKDAAGIWHATHHLAGAPHDECSTGKLAHQSADLSGTEAIVSGTELSQQPNQQALVFRQQGTNYEWQQVQALSTPNSAPIDGGAVALAPSVAIHESYSGAFRIFRKASATGSYQYTGSFQPLGFGLGEGDSDDIRLRNGLFVAAEREVDRFWIRHINVYRERTDGGFEQVALLHAEDTSFYRPDVSQRHVVAMGANDEPSTAIYTFELPGNLSFPKAVLDDFEGGTATWQQPTGNAFAPVQSGTTHVFRQSDASSEVHALLNGTDWSINQSIEAEIKPTAFNGTDRWVGLALRYIDEANFYYLTLRNSNQVAIKKKVNGVFSDVATATLPVSLNTRYRVRFEIISNELRAWVDGNLLIDGARDTALTHGRAGLMAFRTRADFDNVIASGARVRMSDKAWNAERWSFGRPFDELSGNWEITGDSNPEAFSQTIATGDARALLGTPTDNQIIESHAQLDSYGSTPAAEDKWFALLGRYVDENNHYYLSLRNTNRVQIRKKVNGVLTVLKSVPFTVVQGHSYALRFSLLGNQLRGYVDGVPVIEVRDASIASGSQGLATHGATASYHDYLVTQP